MIATTVPFPDHDIDPKEKNDKFILDMAKAIWANRNFDCPNMFYNKAERAAEIRNYALGRQSITKYQKELVADDQSDETWMKIDWTPRSDGMVLRNIALSKLQKAGFNIVATPVNQNAKDAQDEMFNQARVKIMMRDAMLKLNPELADTPQLKMMPGEVEDLEQLETEIEHNPKFIRAKDTEEAIGLVFYENGADIEFDAMAEDIVDFGAGIMKEWLDENNKVRLRHVPYDSFMASYTRKKDFSDITHAGEVVSVKLSDLSKKFGKEDMKTIMEQCAGKYGNPTTFGAYDVEYNGLDRFKAKVLDFEFISWNKRVIEVGTDKYGNKQASKVSPKKSDKSNVIPRTVECVYKGKWVIGTDLVYDWGKAENQKRTVEVATMSKTKLSYHIYAANFDKMRATGMTEQMIPVIDDLNIATYKLRNFRNKMVPNGFDIDLSALENVALGAGGKKMEPQEILNMFFETGVLVSRRSGISMDSNVNYKAINPIQNGMGDQLLAIGQDLRESKQALREITGLNELTDGSTPNPKMLTTIANLANESTNNALYPYVICRKRVIESTAKGCIQRLQIAIKQGPYDGFNKDTGRWVTVPKSLKDFDYDIMIEDKPTDEQKQWLMNLLSKDIEAGYLDTGDVVTIINATNIKSAQIILSSKAKKAKERMDRIAQENAIVTARAQGESNQQAEMIKLKVAMELHQLKLEEIDNEKAWDFVIVQEKNAGAANVVREKANLTVVDANQQPQQQEPQPQQQEPQPAI